ncbi:MAG: hypothetical protein L3J82_02095 [Planctomycetes bacterium]|nr:hypothetical protein [Planctomycetota bacterium]
MMIRIFGAACAALLIFAAVAVASPEAAEAQDVSLVGDANVAGIDSGNDAALVKNDADSDDEKTQKDIQAEKDEWERTVADWKTLLERHNGLLELLKSLLSGVSPRKLAEELKRPEQPEYPVFPDGPWESKEEFEKAKQKYGEEVKKYNEWIDEEAKWFDGLTKDEKAKWKEAVARGREIRRILELAGEQSWKKWHEERLKYLKEQLKDSIEAQKDHCEDYPVEGDEDDS